MTKNPTLRDIAKLADVSLSTVSHVLNNKANVTPEMRERVLSAANSLGYRQKIVSNTPMVSALSTVGVLRKRRQHDQLLLNSFYSYVLDGVERECQRNNLNMMYANIEVDERNRMLNMPAMLLDDLVDGVIVVGAFLEEAIADISRRARCNIVLVDAYTSNPSDFDSVVIDNFNGALTAVTYLIQNGHRHIGLIGSNRESYPSVLERRQGYLAALAQHHIQHTYIEESVLERPDGFEATLRLLKRHPEITAIFACNDNVAIGVMNAARHMGYDVPGDISIVGFDDIDLAQEVMPPLTTIHVDKVLMGTLALRLLRDRVSDQEKVAIKTVITTHLIICASVRRLED